MRLRLVPKSVTLNDLERRNSRYFALFQQVQRKQIDSHKVCLKCPPLVQTQSQLRHQSATAASLTTHAADAMS